MSEKGQKIAAALAQAAPRVALLAGSTGFVGSRLLSLLLAGSDYQRVHALSRRPLTFDHPRLANRIMPLEGIESRLAGFTCQDAYCCLGSTRREAGSDAELRRVDVDLVLGFARAARACGAQRFIVLSSAGAAADARHPYLRHKAEVEQALAGVGFPSLDILRPGPLLGWRGEVRPLELAASVAMPLINPLLSGRWTQFRGIGGREVALAMLGAARSQRKGVYVYAGEGLGQLAQLGRRPPRTGP